MSQAIKNNIFTDKTPDFSTQALLEERLFNAKNSILVGNTRQVDENYWLEKILKIKEKISLK